MTPFVKRAHFDRKIESLQATIRKQMRQNRTLTSRLTQLVNNQKHYLDYRANRMKGYTLYAEKLVYLQRLYDRIKRKYGN